MPSLKVIDELAAPVTVEIEPVPLFELYVIAGVHRANNITGDVMVNVLPDT